MKIADFILENTKTLGGAGCDGPRTDVIALLEKVLEKDRAWILANDGETIKKTDQDSLKELIKRRTKHEPLAYILGHKEFYRREFVVTPNVLIPRPESENFIELARELKTKTFVDIGTGSGCIAITLALELPKVKIIASDISDEALEIAKQNAETLKTKVEFVKSDLLTDLEFNKLKTKYTIVANLPYVEEENITSEEIKAEPKLALFAGKDGLDIYKEFWAQVKKLKNKPEHILVESLETQRMIIAGLALDAGYINQNTLGLVQLFTNK